MASLFSNIPVSAFRKIAGISGCVAVIIGAIASHAPSLNKPETQKYKEIVQTANWYHHIHNLALLAVPFAGKPKLVGILFVSGMTLFCGSVYVVGFTQDKSWGQLAPLGGVALMVGWLSFVL